MPHSGIFSPVAPSVANERFPGTAGQPPRPLAALLWATSHTKCNGQLGHLRASTRRKAAAKAGRISRHCNGASGRPWRRSSGKAPCFPSRNTRRVACATGELMHPSHPRHGRRWLLGLLGQRKCQRSRLSPPSRSTTHMGGRVVVAGAARSTFKQESCGDASGPCLHCAQCGTAC